MRRGSGFTTGDILPGDKFNQVDLIATDNGDRLRLVSGARQKPNPVNCFQPMAVSIKCLRA